MCAEISKSPMPKTCAVSAARLVAVLQAEAAAAAEKAQRERERAPPTAAT